MHDLNTQIANFERTAALRAERLRSKAAALRAEPTTGWDAMDRENKANAAAYDEDARRWDAITAEAKNGYVLVPPYVPYQHEFQALIGAAAAAGRAKFVNPAADPADPGL